MKIITLKDFSEVTDPVKTEATLSEQLLSRSRSIITDKIYVRFPIADTINKYGLQAAQNYINEIQKQEDPSKLFFICQHILVKNLNFGESLVFTPHAEITDNYLPIPHYAAEYDESYIKDWDDREYDYSFVGDFSTHPIRSKMWERFLGLPRTYIVGTGMWRNPHTRSEFLKVLGNTKYSLCPRGTGPGTIRFWESMAMGACPIHIGDSLKLPEAENSSLWCKLSEDLKDLAHERLSSYNNEEYFSRFSNDNLYQSVVGGL